MKKSIYFLFVLSIILLLTSCVYYNTFFNAKKYFSEAVEIKGNNQGKINANIKSTLDKSIRKCAYILKEYPKSKWADNALLLMAKCYYEQENYIKALKRLEEFKEYYENSELYPEAKLYLAKTHLKLYQFQKANEHFSDIFSREKFLNIRDEAYLDFAIYYLEKDDTEKAKQMLRDLLEIKTTKEAKAKANFLLATILYNDNDFKKARQEFEKLIELKLDKNKYLDARLYIIKTYLETNHYEKSHKLLKELEEDETRPQALNKILIYKGVNEANLGDSIAFNKLFARLRKRNLSQEVINLANYYEGSVYLDLYKDYNKAKKGYDNINVEKLPENLVDSYNSKMKLAKKFIEINENITNANFDGLINNYLQIAEIYCFDLVKPHSAIKIYEDIESHFSPLEDSLGTLKEKADSLEYKLNQLSNNIDSTLIDTIKKNKSADSTHTLVDSSLSISDTTISDTTITDTIPADSIINNNEAILDSISLFNSKLKNINTKTDEIQKIYENYYNNQRPKILFLKLWVYKKYLPDSQVKEKIVAKLKDKYPNSKFTKSAQNLLKDKPYVQFISQTQQLENIFDKSQKMYYEENNIDSTFALLDSIIINYPKSSYYPKALYFKSHLLLTEYNDTTSAKPLLKELITDYSDLDFTKNIPSYFNNENFIIPKYENKTQVVKEDSTAKTIIDSLQINNTVSDSTKQEKLLEIMDSTALIDSTEQQIQKQDSLLKKERILPQE